MFSRSHLLLLTAIASLVCACKQTAPPAAFSGPPPAVPVTAAVATVASVPVELHAIGTVEASAVIQVKSQVAGELTRASFTEGGLVNKGDLLFEIDKRPYEQALRQAQAALERDLAQLKQAEANLARDQAQSKFASSDASRYEQLLKEGVASRSQNEQYRTAADAALQAIRADQAAIESGRAALDSDQAAVERAKLDLSFCEVRSPVSGRAGNLLIHAGNLVKANGDNAVVVINQVTPIWVSFAVPEQHLAAIRQNSARRKLEVQVTPQDSLGSPLRGQLMVIDNSVDTNSGTIHLKATFTNEERKLWPGQFVNVVLDLNTASNAILVPSEAVQAGQNGQMIYVVKADKTAEPRIVTVGQTHDGKVVIERGIVAGETVVTDGQLRLYPGAKVQLVSAPKNDQQGL